jgi:hypothetical protein
MRWINHTLKMALTFKVFSAICLAGMLAAKLAIPFNAKPFASGPGDGANIADCAEIPAVGEPLADIKAGHGVGLHKLREKLSLRSSFGARTTIQPTQKQD